MSSLSTRRRSLASVVALTVSFANVGILAEDSAPPSGEAIGVTAIVLEADRTLADGDSASPRRLSGPDARHQLVVTGFRDPAIVGDGAPEVDLSRIAKYSVQPEGIVEVDSTGLITPLADGEATVRIQFGAGESALEASAPIEVRHVANPRPISFSDEIVPIFTKLGCNGGGCHGKSGGQNGFRLSLLGFYPEEGYEYLVKEGRGRRVSVAAPDQSLLLLKATNVMPHGGGARMAVDSHEYRTVRRWMAQGMPFGNADDPKVERLEVFPSVRRMDPKSRQQMKVLAHYSDGEIHDVTHVATYESNDSEMAEVDAGGVVSTLELSGEVAVMVRYQELVGVFRAVVPLGVEIEQLPEARNFIDELVFAKWKNLGVPPSDASDDATFLRRVTIDLAGRLPTLPEVDTFLADASEGKRDALIERLLGSTDYAEYFANKWSAILRNQRNKDSYRRGTYAFHDWLRDSFHQNRPFDRVARDILAASGEVGRNPPAAWYRSVRTVDQQVEDSAQLFLGLRIQCARCHHHPFEVWSQKDYYSYSAFFSRIGRKGNTEGRPDEERIYHKPGRATAKNPRDGATLLPAGLGARPLELDPDSDPRHALVDWMTDSGNPFFAKAFVNRYWKHFFGRGLVEPEDDMRLTNPPAHPELLDGLAKYFVESGFDVKELVRAICRSRVYQLSSIPNEHNATDKQSFSRYYPKRLNAEVLYDSIHDLTKTQAGFPGLPAGTRAVELPDSGVNNYFLTVFGRPMAESSCECERSNDASLAQSLHLLNSKDILGKVAHDDGRAATLAKQKERSIAERIGELYLRAFARPPDEQEIAIARGHIEQSSDARIAFEDIVWALLNTKEFLFNH